MREKLQVSFGLLLVTCKALLLLGSPRWQCFLFTASCFRISTSVTTTPSPSPGASSSRWDQIWLDLGEDGSYKQRLIKLLACCISERVLWHLHTVLHQLPKVSHTLGFEHILKTLSHSHWPVHTCLSPLSCCSSVAALTECMRNKSLAKFFRDRQSSLKRSLPLGSYLLKPVQRILKYHLLLQVPHQHTWQPVTPASKPVEIDQRTEMKQICLRPRLHHISHEDTHTFPEDQSELKCLQTFPGVKAEVIFLVIFFFSQLTENYMSNT